MLTDRPVPVSLCRILRLMTPSSSPLPLPMLLSDAHVRFDAPL